MSTTTVHLLRHGEVHNPGGVLYGRLDGYHLSERGRQMAKRAAAFLAENNSGINHLVASPLTRAQETAEPIGEILSLPTLTDARLIEAANHFEGLTFGFGDGSLRHPSHWRHLINPLRPSWGEPYTHQATRMMGAIDDARRAAEGHEAVLVSHQLPIWVTRLRCEGRRLWHDPRKRECSLASLTSLVFDGDELVDLRYQEPAADLLPGASTLPGA